MGKGRVYTISEEFIYNEHRSIGTGYVGLVQGTILAEFGMNVMCMDVVEEKIAMLKRGEISIYELGLKAILDKTV